MLYVIGTREWYYLIIRIGRSIRVVCNDTTGEQKWMRWILRIGDTSRMVLLGKMYFGTVIKEDQPN